MKRGSIRRHLIAGLIVIAPMTATVVVLWWIFQVLDGLLGRFLYPALGGMLGRETFIIPGLGLLVLFLLLVAIGFAAQRAIGSRIVAWWHATLESIPLTRRIYTAANRIVRTVFGTDARPFKQVVLVEYPSPGRWAIGFLSAAAPPVIQRHVTGAVSVFVPTTPNPTTGFLIIVPIEHIREVDMTVDEAFTYILSAGSVSPDEALRSNSAAGGMAVRSPEAGSTATGASRIDGHSTGTPAP
ncbi:MAG: DUF502 domain-containing protein [Gemmatimonadetes bacterium]|nr:DUF502 domain-containing protein [Gemmatimonadota bacterium]